jgi:SAM-dependent methyltransferase
MTTTTNYPHSGHLCHHAYVLPKIHELLAGHKGPRLIDVGCGNGSASQELAARGGFDVTAIDNSETGIAVAKQTYPNVNFAVADCYDDLTAKYGKFPLVVSLEVVEHLYDPKLFIRRVCDLLEPGGMVVLSTPYNGYIKNVALALLNRFDRHLDPLWDHGHIKFWSIDTLRKLLEEGDLINIRFYRVGRIAALAKSVIVTARRSKPNGKR